MTRARTAYGEEAGALSPQSFSSVEPRANQELVVDQGKVAWLIGGSTRYMRQIRAPTHRGKPVEPLRG